jgi:preprotein translocase subunit SecD
MNQYPLWKYLLVLAVMIVGCLYALPNLYGDDPAVQISTSRASGIGDDVETKVRDALQHGSLPVKSIERVEHSLRVRFKDTDTQLKAKQVIRDALDNTYVVALNLAPATPKWLVALNAAPMYLGLDLRGGVHFLMEVDMKAAVDQAKERYVSDIRSLLRDNRVRYLDVGTTRDTDVLVKLRTQQDAQQTHQLIAKEYRDLVLSDPQAEGKDFVLKAAISQQELKQTREFALEQNITTLRNRVNELGVAEPVIQRQGQDRIVVELPGVQDTARAKEILGATATLEFRLVDTAHDIQDAVAGRVPPSARLYHDRNGNPVLLKKQIIVTGDQIIDASSGFDQQSGSPSVFVTLDSNGARKMGKTTADNIGHPMGVVFIENKTETRTVDGKPVKTTKKVEQVINVATIRDAFSKRFQITGLDTPEEARNLALLLRAGALAAPIDIIEERTVGPSLGQDNINQGFMSTVIGFVVVVIFMIVRYKFFGFIADLALAANVVLIVAILSMLQATLTLPGIAGIVLTVGMAVDANVLIFERVREELRNGNTPQSSIHSGYERAMATIADSNITTLIAALVLFGLGTGPIKGFAVTLSIGILTSMFTAIMGTRAVVNLLYGGRKLNKLTI